MGYRGKLREQQRARQLRAQSWTLAAIADHLGVSKSSVSVWVRDVEFDPGRRRRTGARRRERNALRDRKLREIATLDARGRERMAALSDDAFLAAGVALYAGEGAKRDGSVQLANTDPRIVAFHCRWLRRFFDIDEARLKARLYLHFGLDLEAAVTFWSAVTGIAPDHFTTPHRPVADDGFRRSKHDHGCVTVMYHCSATHREIMGLMRGLLEGAAEGPTEG